MSSDTESKPHKDYDFRYKILLLGDTGVGKSSLLHRITKDEWDDSIQPSTHTDFRDKTIMVNGFVVKLQIWDIPGQESFRYNNYARICYRGTHGVFVIYDVTDKDSFQNVKQWMGVIDRYCWENAHRIIIGNKCDCEGIRTVSSEEVQDLAERFGVPYFETSAKTGENVELALTTMIEGLLEESVDQQSSKTIQENDNSDKKDGKCLLQ